MISDDQPYDEKRLEKLLGLYSEDELTQEHEEELKLILKSNRKARQKYLEIVNMNDELHWSYAESALEIDSDITEIPINKPKSQILIVALAALLLLSISLTYYFISHNHKIQNTVGEAILAKNSIHSSKLYRDRVPKGLFTLKEGQAMITMDSGAEIKLKAPVTMDFKSHIHVKLIEGEVSVNAPKSAMGFRLETAASDFVDIGTKFRVSVNENQSAELHVIDGTVVAKPNKGDMVLPFGKHESGIIHINQSAVIPIESELETQDFLAPESGNVYAKLPQKSRVIFLGDYNSDFETYIHLTQQAIYDHSPDQCPEFFNAGISHGFYFKEDNFKDTVLDMKPTHAVLTFGGEIASYPEKRRMTLKNFIYYYKLLCDNLEKHNIEPILLIAYPLQLNHKTSLEHLNAYNDFIVSYAKEKNYRIANSLEYIQRYIKSNRVSEVIRSSVAYPTYEGHRVLARTVLNVLGYSELPVPNIMRLQEAPGIVKQWRRSDSFTHKKKFDLDFIKNLNTQDWKSFKLPQSDFDKYVNRVIQPHRHYDYQAKSLGVAIGMNRHSNESVLLQSTLISDKNEKKYLNIGGDIQALWFNKKKLPYDSGHGAQHIGYRRFAVEFKKGENEILVQCKDSFFISLTDQKDWPLPRPLPLSH